MSTKVSLKLLIKNSSYTQDLDKIPFRREGFHKTTKGQGKRVQHVDLAFSKYWTRLRQCVQHVGPTFRKCNDIVMTSLIACDCVAFESFFTRDHGGQTNV